MPSGGKRSRMMGGGMTMMPRAMYKKGAKGAPKASDFKRAKQTARS